MTQFEPIDICNKLAYNAGASILAGGLGAVAALAIASPIGALGGACFGCASYIVGYPVRVLIDYLMTCGNNKKANDCLKLISFAVSVFAGIAASWALTVAAGVSFTFSAAVILSLAIYATFFTIVFMLACCGCAAVGNRVLGISHK